MNKFYTYVHTKPNGEIFYVGKGTKKRSHQLICQKRRRSTTQQNALVRERQENP
jgi:hypothetical protein